MIGLSGVRLASVGSDQSLEKKAQKINTVATGITAAGIAGAAVAAGAVTNRVKLAMINERLIKIAPQNVNMNKLDKAIISTVNLANKAVASIKNKLAPSVESLTAKVTPALTVAKDKVLGNTVVQKIIISSVALASDVAYKSSKVLSNVQNYVTNLPKPVKIAALAATGILAVSHVYRSGQISGIFAAPKQES